MPEVASKPGEERQRPPWPAGLPGRPVVSRPGRSLLQWKFRAEPANGAASLLSFFLEPSTQDPHVSASTNSCDFFDCDDGQLSCSALRLRRAPADSTPTTTAPATGTRPRLPLPKPTPAAEQHGPPVTAKFRRINDDKTRSAGSKQALVHHS